ncbi:MAG: dihydropyrimidinase [Conexivisphaerales archaeon]
MTSLLVKNAKVVTSRDIFDADILSEDGIITSISRSIDPNRAERRIDASGKLLFPGGIDGHTHFEMPFMGTTTADDFYSGTVSAAAGGITAIIDFAVQQKGELLSEAVRNWHNKARNKAVVDYSFHVIFRDVNEKTLNEVKEVIASGITSFKVFTTYRKEGLMLEDGEIMQVMKTVSSNGGLVAVHAENNGIAETNIATFMREGKKEAIYHALSKPQIVEAEAVQRMLTLAAHTKARMYIVHLSSKPGRELIRDGMLRGLAVFAETCPHYLVFDESVYSRVDAKNFVMSPPIKGKEDREALWEGLRQGDVKTVASDHADFTSEQKSMGNDDFTKIPNGVAGTEVIIPVLFTEGYKRGRISLNRFVEVTSTNAARAYNLYPKKGTISVGSDADFYILDPQKKVRLTADALHSRIDYSIYDDFVAEGYPVITVSRGEVIYEDGQFIGKAGRGTFLARKASHEFPFYV